MLRKRRTLRWLLIACALLAAVVLALPWWLPAVASQAAGFFGVEIGDRESHGWSGVTYREVVVVRPGLRATIAELRTPLFLVRPRGGEAGPVITARDVVVAITATEVEPPPAERPVPSARAIVVSLAEVWPVLRKWLPPTSVDGLRIDAGPTAISIATALWDGRALSAEGALPGSEERATAVAAQNTAGAFELSVAIPERSASIDALFTLAPASLSAEATLKWLDNTAAVRAGFGNEGLLPESASVDAPAVRVEPELIGLTGYGPLTGNLRADWNGSEYTLVAHANATPLPGNETLPPLLVDLRGGGDFARIRIDAADVTAPGIVLALSSPVEWIFSTGALSASAVFSVAIDLAQVPWVSASGAIEGAARIEGGGEGAPRVAFDLSGRDVVWRTMAVTSLDVEGAWSPPHLRLGNLEVRFDDASFVRATGEVDLTQRSVLSGDIELELAHAVAILFAPSLPGYEALELEASVTGPLGALEHRGALRLTKFAGLPGGDVDGSLDWSGAGFAGVNAEAVITSVAGVSLPASARITREDSGVFVVAVNALAWNDEAGEWWKLQQPARVEITPGGTAAQVSVDQLHLSGAEVDATLQGTVRWPGEGNFSVTFAGFDSTRIRAFIPPAATGVRIDALQAKADWDNGPVTFDGSVSLIYAPAANSSYSAAATFNSGEAHEATSLDVRISDVSGVVLSGEGTLPLALMGRDAGFEFRLPRTGPVALTLTSQPNIVFWTSIAELTGWAVTDPHVSVEITGTLEKPRGHVELVASGLAMPKPTKGGLAVPPMRDLALRVTADDDGVALDEGIVAIDTSWVRVTGRAPWEAWRTLVREKQFPWMDAHFEIASSPLAIAIASKVFPTVLAPDGEVSIGIKHQPGSGFAGRVWLHDASLRPIPPVGAIRDINAEVTFDEYAAKLEKLEALIGGRPIEITGNGSMRPGEEIEFDLHAVSSRVPVVRDAGLVVRASLDLRASRKGKEPARIAGKVELGSSVYVSDLVSLLPTGSVTTPEQRPPFFSVREQPYADWTLDIELKGVDFLRVENPLFEGTMSADFHLDGTLAEPRAIGRITASKGSVAFPFARLPLEQLELTLSPENPYEPAILATGGTRVFGYDVRMEATGKAADPRVLFTANPPLSSQAVFLMLTTGALPDESRSFSSSARTQRLAFFLGRNLASGFGLGGGSGNGGDQLTVRSGENFSREGRETLYVQYDLNGRWSVVGEYDRFDAYNGGIKFRIIDR